MNYKCFVFYQKYYDNYIEATLLNYIVNDYIYDKGLKNYGFI